MLFKSETWQRMPGVLPFLLLFFVSCPCRAVQWMNYATWTNVSKDLLSFGDGGGVVSEQLLPTAEVTCKLMQFSHKMVSRPWFE